MVHSDYKEFPYIKRTFFQMQLEYFKSPFPATINKLHPNVLHLLALVVTKPTVCNGMTLISLVSPKLSDFPGNFLSSII